MQKVMKVVFPEGLEKIMMVNFNGTEYLNSSFAGSVYTLQKIPFEHKGGVLYVFIDTDSRQQ